MHRGMFTSQVFTFQPEFSDVPSPSQYRKKRDHLAHQHRVFVLQEYAPSCSPPPGYSLLGREMGCSFPSFSPVLDFVRPSPS